MNPTTQLLSTQELAARWGRTEAAIALARSVGVGPCFTKVGGQIRYLVDEVQRFERACLFFEPAEVALQTVR